jgi:hypothetical protein
MMTTALEHKQETSRHMRAYGGMFLFCRDLGYQQFAFDFPLVLLIMYPTAYPVHPVCGGSNSDTWCPSKESIRYGRLVFSDQYTERLPALARSSCVPIVILASSTQTPQQSGSMAAALPNWQQGCRIA